MRGEDAPVAPADGHGARTRILWWVAIAVWVLTYGLIAGLWLGGYVHSLSYRVYATAGEHWLGSEPLYELDHIEGFQYLPQSAVLVSPLAALGSPTGDLLWRLLGWCLLGLGTYRCTRLVAPSRHALAFLIATGFTLLTGVGPLTNGQANLGLAGLTLLATADLAEKRWWWASATLAIGFALKPHMIVLLLLAAGVNRAVGWRTAILLVGVAVAPWLFRDHPYVMAEYAAWFQKLRLGVAPGPVYEDLRGLLATAGWVMPHAVATPVRLVAAVMVFGLALRTQIRFKPRYAALLLAALATSYLMLFNPRTQSTTYAIVAGVAAVPATAYFLEGRRHAASFMSTILLGWAVNYHWAPFIELWLKPLLCVGFLGFTIRETWGGSPEWLNDDALPQEGCAPPKQALW